AMTGLYPVRPGEDQPAPDTLAAAGSGPGGQAADLLRVGGLTVTYRTGRGVPALSDVSLSVPAGSCLGLVGESGAGKTTFGHAVLGLLGPEAEVSGELVWDGVPVGYGSAAHHQLLGTGIGF